MKRSAAIAIVVLPIVGAVLGRLAGPFLARAHGKVQLAERIWREDSQGLADHTLESEAFRATPHSKDQLFAEARRVQARFRFGGAIFGLWCGLVLSCKLFGLGRVPNRDSYAINHAACVCCTRCYATCPRERLRRGEIVIIQHASEVTTEH